MQVALKLYLPPEEAAKIRQIADAEGRTVTGLIRLAIRQYLQAREATQNAA